jgi:cytochrome b561
MLKNTENSYGIIAKSFHWLIFLMLSFMIVVGNLMANMPKGNDKFEMIMTHKSFGAILLTLIMLRFIWRLLNPVPKDLGDNAMQNLMAHIMHWVLYALMFAQPLSGIFMSQSAGYPVSFFGLFEFPAFLSKNQELAEFFNTAHSIIWILLILAVAGHMLAALKHHFIDKDNTLKRMLGKRINK